MPSLRKAILLPVLSMVCGCAPPSSTVKAYPRGEVPEPLLPRVTRAEAALDALQQRLSQRLMEEIGRGGVVAAVGACREQAPELTMALERETGVRIGRTSHRLRNAANVPPDWARSQVAAGTGKRAAELTPVVFDLGESVGLLRPLPTQGLCTNCHGDPAAFAPELATLLGKSYPDDRATGFAEGDLRGWAWAQVR